MSAEPTIHLPIHETNRKPASPSAVLEDRHFTIILRSRLNLHFVGVKEQLETSTYMLSLWVIIYVKDIDRKNCFGNTRPSLVGRLERWRRVSRSSSTKLPRVYYSTPLEKKFLVFKSACNMLRAHKLRAHKCSNCVFSLHSLGGSAKQNVTPRLKGPLITRQDFETLAIHESPDTTKTPVDYRVAGVTVTDFYFLFMGNDKFVCIPLLYFGLFLLCYRHFQ